MPRRADPDVVGIVTPQRGTAFDPASCAKALIEEIDQGLARANPAESNLDDHWVPSERPGEAIAAIPPRLDLDGVLNRELAGVTGKRNPQDLPLLKARDHSHYGSDLRHEPP